MAASLSSRELRAGLSETLGRVAYGRERIIVTRQGKRFAAIVPLDDLETLEALEDLRDAQIADKALQDFRESGEFPVALADVARELVG